MPNSSLPPSRFSAGYTAGTPPPPPPALLHPAAVAQVSPAFAPPVDAPPTSVVVRINPLAAVSLVLVLFLGPFVAPATLPMGLVARSQISRSRRDGKGLATAAIALSCVYLAAAAVLLTLAITTGSVAGS